MEAVHRLLGSSSQYEDYGQAGWGGYQIHTMRRRHVQPGENPWLYSVYDADGGFVATATKSGKGYPTRDAAVGAAKRRIADI